VRLPRRVTASTIVATLIAAGLAGCSSGDDTGGDVTDVVIGADLTVGSTIDTAYARALQLKIDQLNASGELGGRRLVLRIQDNRDDTTSSLRNIGTFADDPQVAAIVTGSCGECVVDARKIINDKHIPTIALAPGDDVSNPVGDRRYIFKLATNPADSATALVSELTLAGIKKVALLYTDGLYGHDGDKAMREVLDKAKITVTKSQTVLPAATDINQAVAALTADQPAALVAVTSPDQAALAATSAHAAGFTDRMYFDAGAAGDTFVPQKAVTAMNNAEMVFTQILAIDDVVATTPAKASRQQWFRDYTSHYGSYSGVASFAADAVDLISGAVARVGGDRERIRDILETSQTDGLSGAIRMTPDNHSGLMPQSLTLLVVRSGRWRIAS
jgi:branched-chain amino acid transport system substrate-binding protein